MSFGVTTAGFVRKTYSDILAEKQAEARSSENFGPDVDLSDASPVGVFVKMLSKGIAESWEEAEDAYYSLHPDSAQGVQLDRICSKVGLTRKAAQKALVTETLTGTASTVVPAGTQIQTAQEVVFSLIANATIGGGGTVAATFRAVVAGESGNVAAGSLVDIVTPVSGLLSATNAAAGQGGQEIETDEDLRGRFYEVEAITGSSVPALEKALRDLAGVTSASVLENWTETTDANSVPPKSFEAIVVGGLAADIADAIYQHKPAGIRPYGALSEALIDSKGTTHNIGYSRQTDVTVYVTVDLTVNSDWDSAYAEAVKRNIVRYVGGTDLQVTPNVVYGGLNPGQDIVPFQIGATMYGDASGQYETIQGLVSIVVKVGLSASPTGTTVLEMSPRQDAQTDTDKIVVNVL